MSFSSYFFFLYKFFTNTFYLSLCNINFILAKKKRKPYSKIQIDYLERWFEQNKERPYASRKERLELSDATNLTQNQISFWLMYKRKKLKISLMENK